MSGDASRTIQVFQTRHIRTAKSLDYPQTASVVCLGVVTTVREQFDSAAAARPAGDSAAQATFPQRTKVITEEESSQPLVLSSSSGPFAVLIEQDQL